MTTGLVATPVTASAADTSPPTQAGAITVAGVTATSAALSWAKSTDDVEVIGYRVYRGPASATVDDLSLIASLDPATSYSATRLYSNTAYTFGVRAIDAAGNKSVMRTVQVTTSSRSDTTAPSATSTPTALVFSDDRVDITWSASSSSDVAGYQVLRQGAVVATVDLPAALRYSDNGLSPGTSYSYTVKAKDANGLVSAASSARSAKTLPAGTVRIARGPFSSAVTGSSAVISWWTNEPTTGSVTIDGNTVTDPAGSAHHHEVVVTGLPAGSSHPYTVSSGGVTATGTLRTAATPGQTFSFAMIGDFGGGGSGATSNAASIKAAGTDFIQTVGDNVYPSSGLPDPNFATTYSDFDQRFFKPFGSTIKEQSFHPANGNKEYYGDGQWWDAFPMHGSNQSWYAYDWGDAHILVLDTERPYLPGSEQYAFAEADLAANQSAKWRIVVTHGPPYSSSSAGASSDDVREHLVPLFQRRKVHLVASGNSHNYERTHPMLNGAKVVSGGVTYLVTGAGGNGLNDFSLAQPAYTAYRQDSFFQFTKVTVSPTELLVEGRRADTGVVFDSTTIMGSAGDTTAPTAPTGLSATAVSSSRVNLSWTASSDEVGVTEYEVYRGATLLTTVTGTSTSDTTVVPSTEYSYTVKAKDAADNVSPASDPALVTTPSGAGESTTALNAMADARVEQANPTTNYGTSSSLAADQSSTAQVESYLKFDPAAVTGTVATAKLRLWTTTGSTSATTDGPKVHGVSADWAEGAITWNTKPAPAATESANVGAIAGDTLVEYDVTDLVASGTYNFALIPDSSDGANFNSRTNSATTKRPQLVLATG